MQTLPSVIATLAEIVIFIPPLSVTTLWAWLEIEMENQQINAAAHLKLRLKWGGGQMTDQ
jgi:hypothetical protein